MTSRGRASRLLGSVKNRIKNLDLPYDLTLNWLEKKITTGRCEVTGIPFDLSVRHDGHGHPYAPSLDRIVFGAGYTKRNTRVVVWQFNTARWNHGDQQLRQFIRDWRKNDPTL